MRDALDREEAVPEIGLGRRAGADARAASREQVELGTVGVRGVDDGRARRRGSRCASSSSIGRQPCSARHSSISRGCSSAWTCSGSSLALGVAAELLEPVARAGADGVGGDADADPVGAQLTRARRRYSATDSWRKRSSPPRPYAT